MNTKGDDSQVLKLSDDTDTEEAIKENSSELDADSDRVALATNLTVSDQENNLDLEAQENAEDQTQKEVEESKEISKAEAIKAEDDQDDEKKAEDDLEEGDQDEEIFVEDLDLLSEVTGGLGTVIDPLGKLAIVWKFDGGSYEGQVGIVPIAGMENYDLNSQEFLEESLRRALTNIIVDDTTEGAEFAGDMADGDFYRGDFAGEKIIQLQAGGQFFLAVIPNGTFADVLASLEKGETPMGNLRPLFSFSTPNPGTINHFVQLVDLTGGGTTFALEDIQSDQGSDWDLNDLIITIKGANIDALTVDELIESGILSEAPQWMEEEAGQVILESAVADVVAGLSSMSAKYEFPRANQPLIGFIDSHLTSDNLDIDYSRITFGPDYMENDTIPTTPSPDYLDNVDNIANLPNLANADNSVDNLANQNGTHLDHVLGIVGATQGNGIGIDGINDNAPLWVSSTIGSGRWAEALVEFVDAVKASGQPNGLINLSLDLAQVQPDDTVTTRYEFTTYEREALEYARQNHILIVTAAGNDGAEMSALGKASQEFDNIITVGSVQSKIIPGALPQITRAEYSSFGNGLTLMAEGGTEENPILSNAGDGLGTMAGTSVATAKVTGIASQVWAANPQLTYPQVIEILKQTAVDLETPGWDAETGFGLVNLVAAVNLARNTSPRIYDPAPIPLSLGTWDNESPNFTTERAVGIFGKIKDFLFGKKGSKIFDIASQVFKIVTTVIKPVSLIAQGIILGVKVAIGLYKAAKSLVKLFSFRKKKKSGSVITDIIQAGIGLVNAVVDVFTGGKKLFGLNKKSKTP